MYQGSYTTIDDFSGGYCGNLGASTLALNQALDEDNIVLSPDGKGWRARNGNTAVNSTAFNSGAFWQGLGYIKSVSQQEYIVGVAGSKFGGMQKSGGAYPTSFTDFTNGITITSGSGNKWDFFTFNDKIYGYGGPPDAPDAPFESTGGNATAVGGSAPSAYGAFAANNRAFAFRTSALPSTIYWSVLGNAEDWSSTGSGSAVVGSLSDNQKITGAAVLSTNYAIIFKETSTYQMVISSAPFPVYTLFPSVGCVGKHARIVADGIVYWITQYGRMVSTDGQMVKDYPPAADNLWNNVQTSQLKNIEGFRQKGVDYDWLVWCVSTTGTTNNKAIIWDLKSKCWLQATTGYPFNAFCMDLNSVVRAGGFDGVLYNLDVSGTTTDASNSGGAVTSFWRSGWLNKGAMEQINQVNELGVLFKVSTGNSIAINYGFNFVLDGGTSVSVVSQTATGSETRRFVWRKLSGRGNYFNFKINSNNLDAVMLRGKIYGQKVFDNP